MKAYYNCTNHAIGIGKGQKDLLPGQHVLHSALGDARAEKLLKLKYIKVVDEVQPEVVVEEPQVEVYGPFRYSPEQLEEKTLEQLNTMIAEIDDSIDPYETREEAVAQLGADL